MEVYADEEGREFQLNLLLAWIRAATGGHDVEAETRRASFSSFILGPPVPYHGNDTFNQIYQTTVILAHITLYLPPPCANQSWPPGLPSSLAPALNTALLTAVRNFGNFKRSDDIAEATGYLQALMEFCGGRTSLEMRATRGGGGMRIGGFRREVESCGGVRREEFVLELERWRGFGSL